MSKETLDFHPSLMVGYSPDSEKLVLSCYDQGYPKKIFRGSANMIGGNIDPKLDKCPEDVLLREVREEYNPNHGIEKLWADAVQWASDEDIRSVRNALFQFKPLQDFRVRQPKVDKDAGESHIECDNGINSVYLAEISGEVVETLERNLRDGLNIPSEGNVGVYTLKGLTNSPHGIYSTAWATPRILNWHFGSNIPCSDRFSLDPIGMPRKSFSEYAEDFKYNDENLAKAANAEL